MGASVGSGVAPRCLDRRRSRSIGLALAIVFALASGCGTSATPMAPSAAVPTPTTPTATPAATAPAPTVAPTPVATRVKPHWLSAGTMSVARESTHVLLLGDGRVLVVGDDRWSDARYRWYLSTVDTSVIAELWDPGTSTWRTSDPLPKARGGFAAVVLADGRALVVGGANQECASFSSAYLFDPDSEFWSKTGLMGTARTQPAAAVLRDGRVLVAGGAYSQSCYDFAAIVYDRPPASSGVTLASFHSPIDGPASTAPRFDDVDMGPLGHALATAELFDPSTGTWSDTGPMRQARVGASAVTLADGRVLVWGGSEEYGAGHPDRAEVYDPETGRFTWTEALPALDGSTFEALDLRVPRGSPDEWAYGGTLLSLVGGDALLVGVAQWWDSYEVSRSFGFQPGNGTWEQVAGPLALVRETNKTVSKHALNGILAPLRDGRVLVARDTGKVQLFDPGSGKWSKAPPMPGDRDAGVTVTLEDGSVLLVPVGQGYSEAFRFVP